MAKITRAKRFRTTIKKLISRHKRRARRRNSSHRCRYMLLAISLLALSGGLLPDAVFAESTVWTFEEVLAARDKYEPQAVAKCNGLGGCELNAYQDLVKNGEPDARAAGMLAANGLLITYIHPQTGVIKLFYNNRASVLTRTDGQAKPIISVRITWIFEKTDQTYEFTDASQIIPQQEITLKPEGVDFSSGVTVSKIDAQLTLEGDAKVSRKLGPQNCMDADEYAPGKECRLVADSAEGFVLRPTGEATIVPPTPGREDGDSGASSSKPTSPEPTNPESSSPQYTIPLPQDPTLITPVPTTPSVTPPIIFPPRPDDLDTNMGHETDSHPETTPQTPQLPQVPILPERDNGSSDSLFAGAAEPDSPADSIKNGNGATESANSSTKIPLAPNTAAAPARFDRKQLLIHFSLALTLFNLFALALRYLLHAH